METKLQMVETKQPIYIVGDVHGCFALLQQQIKRFDFRDCIIICVGDLGIGFAYATDKKKEHRIHAQLDEWFARRGIKFYSIRGNHDDPQFFTGENRVVYDNFELLEDYTTLELNGEKILLIGGAISVDRIRRKEGVSYWKGEALVFKPELLTSCDALITHSAPTWNGPFNKIGLNSFSNWEVEDPTLWSECYKERTSINEMIRITRPKQHYCGHFHQYSWADNYGCCSTILDILQFKEHQ